MKFKALGCICIIEIAGTIGAVMKNPAAAGICLTGTCFLTGYTAYLEMRRMQIKICPECKCEIQKSYRICPECGHLFQTGISNEKLTDFIEKEKEAENCEKLKELEQLFAGDPETRMKEAARQVEAWKQDYRRMA